MRTPLRRLLALLLTICAAGLACEGGEPPEAVRRQVPLEASARPGSSQDARLVAEQITRKSAKRLRVGGIDAIGGIGDWALGNGTVCAVISDSQHETYLSQSGGVLVDLGFCGRADDQWTTLHPLVNLGKERVLSSDAMEAGIGEREAWVRSRGERDGIAGETIYLVDVAKPNEVLVETRLTRVSEGEGVARFGDVMLHPHRSLTPFAISTRGRGRSPGFTHPHVDTRDNRAMMDAMLPTDLIVLMGEPGIEPGISYGLQQMDSELENADGEGRSVEGFAINGRNFSMLGVLSRPLWLGGGRKLGALEMAQSLLMDIELGETLVLRRRIILGQRADVASVTDQIYGGPLLRGQVESSRVSVEVTTAAGEPITWIRPESDGRFEARLPALEDDFFVIWHAPWSRSPSDPIRVTAGSSGRGDPAAASPMTASAADDTGTESVAIDAPGEPAIELGRIDVGVPSRVRLPRNAGPMRLVFKGVGDFDDPVFHSDGSVLRIGGKQIPTTRQANYLSLAGVSSDPEEVAIPPGRYRVWATRGIEFGVSEAELLVNAGETVTLEIAAPQRVVETPGWISADLHVHAAPSFDSAIPVGERIASFVAQGAEVLVSSEHDRIYDYGAVARELGVARLVSIVTGSELTGLVRSPRAPRSMGHANVFPLPARPLEYAGGLPGHEGRRMREVIGDMRTFADGAVFQLNHPRDPDPIESDVAFFDHLSVGRPYDPRLPLDHATNRVLIERDSASGLRDLDFDAMEIANGHQMLPYRLVRADWFSLLLQGEVRTGTANSDSHGNMQIVAMPRTYVRVSRDEPTRYSQAEFIRSIKQGRVFGSTGPLLELDLEGAGIGDTFRGTSGTLALTVRAAPWVPVERATVYVDGDLVQEFALQAGERVELGLQFEADAFVVVEVSGSADERYAAIAPGFTPFAFSNPIFVDADGDGQWQAPGLPDELPAAIASPQGENPGAASPESL
ncbi:MAG: CehA/McbA family metallohydrolase [Deltaproteobacteria bacterium]|nr:CehA/McbA family metallohydrolase [Deltaproteobacteria bacterium]MBW2420336.1 CehA/McbA family metallohydrolase [Deltaproteobacteria bacterium]